MRTEHANGKSKIVVVGSCASGKTSLVTELLRRGHDAVVCAQEHSEVAGLWRRSAPDMLVLLDVDLATIRARRGAAWPAAVFTEQQRRLTDARAAAHLIIDSRTTSRDQAVAEVERAVLAISNAQSTPDSDAEQRW